MNYGPTRHQRRSIRLPGFDYAQAGEYFVTICTQGKTPFFEDVLDGNMCFSKAGMIATQCWSEIPSHFERVSLDTYVVMPNHLHGILTFHTIVGIQNPYATHINTSYRNRWGPSYDRSRGR